MPISTYSFLIYSALAFHSYNSFLSTTSRFSPLFYEALPTYHSNTPFPLPISLDLNYLYFLAFSLFYSALFFIITMSISLHPLSESSILHALLSFLFTSLFLYDFSPHFVPSPLSYSLQIINSCFIDPFYMRQVLHSPSTNLCYLLAFFSLLLLLLF